MLDINPVFYILMRTDLASMNPGKAVAQGSHAANQFEKRIRELPQQNDTNRTNEITELHKVWLKSADGFGTAITLGVNATQLSGAIDYAKRSGQLADFVNDPTYPLVDGEFVHLIPLVTCGWVFGDKSDIQWLLTDLQLMK